MIVANKLSFTEKTFGINYRFANENTINAGSNGEIRVYNSERGP